MYIQNRRDISKFGGCSPLQICNGLISLKPAIAYFAYTEGCMPFKKKPMNKRNLKYLITIISLAVLLYSFHFKGNYNSNREFEQTIIKVVRAFKEKNETALNSLISKEKGLIVLFRPALFDEYSKTDKIDFDIPVPGYLPYSDFVTDYKLIFASLPTYDCNSMKWSKIGLFCDTTIVDNLLSTTAWNLKKYREDNIPEYEIQAFEKLEKNSRRIVLSDSFDGELVFYLTLINDKWYLTILDRLSSDCSA